MVVMTSFPNAARGVPGVGNGVLHTCASLVGKLLECRGYMGG
jgi:hypothetical protein